jgi:DNA-binding MarR family transcriptional regulator
MERLEAPTTADQDHLIEEVLSLLSLVFEGMAGAESGPKDFGTGVPLHRAETHAIRAIGRDEPRYVVELAGDMGVTKGAMSQLVARLHGKGLVEKRPSPDDARATALYLTPLGRTAYLAHERFHARMNETLVDHLGTGPQLTTRLSSIRDALLDLNGILEDHARQTT